MLLDSWQIPDTEHCFVSRLARLAENSCDFVLTYRLAKPLNFVLTYLLEENT